MKNAILPTIVLVSATLILGWQEIEAYNESPETRKVQINAFDRDSKDLMVDGQSNSVSLHIDSATELLLKSLVESNSSLEQLTKDPKFVGLNEHQKFYAQKHLLKTLLKREPEIAIPIAEKLIVNNKPDASLQFNVALAYRKLDKIDKAVHHYEQLISKFPEHQAGIINLGMLYKKQEQWLKAEETLKRAVEISNGKKKAKAFSLLGSVYQKQTKYSLATESFRKSIQYRPGHAATWLSLAETMQNNERPYQKVITTYKRASKLAPSNYRVLRKLGLYQLENLEFLDAQRTFSKALELAPHSLDAHRGLAWTYTEMGDYSEALKSWSWLEKNEKSKSRSKFAYFAQNAMEHIIRLIEGTEVNNLPLFSPSSKMKSDFEQMNLVLMEARSRNSAKANFLCFNSLDALNTLSHRSLYKHAKCALNQKNTDNAAKLLAVLQRKMSNSAEVLILLGRSLNQQGDFEKAEEKYLMATRILPDRLDLIVERVKNLVASGHYEKAKLALSAASRKFRDDMMLTDLSAEIAWLSMEWSLSLKLYQILSEWEPQIIEYRYRHAYSAIKEREYELAKKSLQEVLSINAAHIDARILLAQTHCNIGELNQCKTEAKRVLKLDRNNQSARRLTKL